MTLIKVHEINAKGRAFTDETIRFSTTIFYQHVQLNVIDNQKTSSVVSCRQLDSFHNKSIINSCRQYSCLWTDPKYGREFTWFLSNKCKFSSSKCMDVWRLWRKVWCGSTFFRLNSRPLKMDFLCCAILRRFTDVIKEMYGRVVPVEKLNHIVKFNGPA